MAYLPPHLCWPNSNIHCFYHIPYYPPCSYVCSCSFQASFPFGYLTLQAISFVTPQWRFIPLYSMLSLLFVMLFVHWWIFKVIFLVCMLLRPRLKSPTRGLYLTLFLLPIVFLLYPYNFQAVWFLNKCQSINIYWVPVASQAQVLGRQWWSNVRGKSWKNPCFTKEDMRLGKVIWLAQVTQQVSSRIRGADSSESSTFVFHTRSPTCC